MASVRVGARGDAPADAVWISYMEPARWPDWSPQIRRAVLDDDRARITVGATGRVWTYAPVPLRFEVLAVDYEQRCWTWAVGPAGARLQLEHRVIAEADGTSTTLVVSGPRIAWPLMIGYLPMARLALRRLVAV